MPYFFDKEGENELKKFITRNKLKNIFVITDTHTKEYCLPVLQEIIPNVINFNIHQGESYKNIDTVYKLWEQLLSHNADRESLLINLGGGIVTDIGGFTAATYKRGIKFIHVPTSLLGMVDAAIGGKNGINFNGIKNQIGTIVSPEFTWINTRFLKTLPAKEFDSGFAEMLKHGLIADIDYWHQLIAFSKNKDKDSLPDLIQKSVLIKSAIVKNDPNELGLRKVLNFGHTLGHALESYLHSIHKPVTHGHAVAIGMIMAGYISSQLTGLSKSDTHEIKHYINDLYPVIGFHKTDINKILALLKFDKKNKNGTAQFVLLTNIGKPVFNQEIPEKLLYEAFSYYSQ